MRQTRLLGLTLGVAVLAAMALEASGAGLLIPKQQDIPPLAIKYLRVDVSIDNQVATTRIVQEFQNSTSRNLECTYIFPLPRGAAVRDFAMYIGGKRMKGELVEREKARRVYESIVRRMKDPGLLEYMDGSLLRMRIFPVPAKGTQKIEIEYTQLVPMDNGLAEYTFPLRTGKNASRTLEDFTVAVRIKSDTEIKSVYSPSHTVGISRPSDYEAVAGVETKSALLSRDFQLFYTLSKKAFGLNIITYRPDPKEPGMFLLLISPKIKIPKGQRISRDVAFVLDTSGSMRGDKIQQAKDALKFCIGALAKDDRFAIVQFSTMAQSFGDGWTGATEKNKKAARKWVGEFEAGGGTNIGEALELALDLPVDPDRPATIMFLTDGLPTVGTTDIAPLNKLVKDKNQGNLRIFTFGVGDDVNTHLLDKMSDTTGGLPAYVRPGEAIDGKVTRLFSKMSHPVMTNLKIDIPGVKVIEMYPRQLPDLFRGTQLVLVGAYKNKGESAIRLTGRVGKKRREFVYEGKFPRKNVKRSFIAPIFAHRKIGYLLDQIRLNGETKELKDEVIRLSVSHGIETPYTSYLVLESDKQYAQHGIARSSTVRAFVGGKGGRSSLSADESKDAAEVSKRTMKKLEALDQVIGIRSAPGFDADEEIEGFSDARETPAAGLRYSRPKSGEGGSESRVRTGPAGAKGDRNYGRAYMRIRREDLKGKKVGKEAVDIAQELQRRRQTETLEDVRAVRKVVKRGGREMVNYRGVWVDEKFEGDEKITKVKWASDAYFKILREKPELKKIFSLGK
ncbi:MAG: VIT domain-containing protein, partial [Phycisphaerae bacterium]|nr:VIT domain-containing protein [Phycisphaerae bacterium]